MLNFVLCDDNNAVLDKLSKMIDAVFIKNKIDAQISLKTTSAKEVLDYINHNNVNVLFLDIELKSDISGLELAEKIRKTNKSIYFVFLTGHLEYMLTAYKVKTFDYLPKPVTVERLEETIIRIFSDAKQSPKKYIRIDKGNTIIDQDSIYYIHKDGMKLIFQTENRSYEVYSSFTKIQSCLPDNFVRCHKSYIANIDKVSDIKNSSMILFDDELSCSIGPKYKNNFLEVFNHGNFSKYVDSFNN